MKLKMNDIIKKGKVPNSNKKIENKKFLLKNLIFE